ncbi:MAG: transposase [Chloroflexi bacterium]|nr:transposase [Chloroflexota bacterium]
MPNSSKPALGFTTILATCGRFWISLAGVARSRNAVHCNGTKKPLPIGSATPGPRLKKADRLGAHLIFLDESGFLLIPNVKRTWAPKGQTPKVGYWLKRKKISAMSALAVSPKRKRVALYLQFRRRSFKGPDVVRFLQSLLRQLTGPGVLLWDAGPIHRHRVVKSFLQTRPQLHVHKFPGYAPELNPAEYVWSQSDSTLANSAPEEVEELQGMLNSIKRRLRNSQSLLWSCIYASDLPWK